MTVYYVPGRPSGPRPVVPKPAGPATVSPSAPLAYFVAGSTPRKRWLNPVRRAQLARRYPHAGPAVLDLLAQYPEEGADPETLEQLAALTPGQTIAQLLRRRYPGERPGPAPERGGAPLFRKPRRRPEPRPNLTGVPF